MISIDYNFVENFNDYTEEPFFVYGIGNHGKRIIRMLEKLHFDIQGVIVTSQNATNLYENYKIVSVAEFNQNKGIIIIASYRYADEMIESIERMCDRNIKICTAYAFYMAIYMNRSNCAYEQSFAEELEVDCNIQFNWNSILHENYLYRMYANAITSELPLILTPGKVGSLSIYEGLREKAIHLHSLTLPYSFDTTDKQLYEKARMFHLKKKVKILSLVRNPIVRDISAFFQHTDADVWPWFREYDTNFLWFTDCLYSKVSFSELYKERQFRWGNSIKDACERYLQAIIEYKSDEFSWFNYEIRDYFGIDVYAQPFDKEKGYEYYSNGNIELLLIKLEKIEKLQDVISDYFKDPEFKMVSSNTGEKKNYRYLYKELKKHINISNKYLEYYLNNKKALHFYDESEIKKSVQKLGC